MKAVIDDVNMLIVRTEKRARERIDRGVVVEGGGLGRVWWW